MCHSVLEGHAVSTSIGYTNLETAFAITDYAGTIMLVQSQMEIAE